MVKKHILYEHALGYALIRSKAATVEALAELAQQMNDNEEEFCKNFKLCAFAPFGSSAEALQNCNAVSEGMVHEDLKQFLLQHLPLESAELSLCVSERKLADAIKSPETGLPDHLVCASESALAEVYRALRLNFPTYIKELSHFAESKAQIGLGHSYSRAKVKFNVNRNDNMIIQSINLLDQLDKDVNSFCMRIKEWFSYHFPELIKIVPDNVTFIKVIGLIGTRDRLTEENREALEDVVGAEAAQTIFDAALSSFGFDITSDDSGNLTAFTEKILALVDRRKKLQEYLASKLSNVAPNLSLVAGERVCARLISHAGSLMNLAKFPASTIQILGAEKALFRALRKRGKTPKYGLIYHNSFITRAAKEHKGRISRFLAAKCAIACRLDCFSEVLNDIYGRHLRQQIEDRLSFFETGKVAPTNAEAMAIANAEAHKFIRKMKKKAIKTLQQRAASSEDETVLPDGNLSLSSKKRKKKAKQEKAEENNVAINEPVEDDSLTLDTTTEEKKNKKKRKRSKSIHMTSLEAEQPSVDVAVKSRKRSASESSVMLNEAEQLIPQKKKAKKHAF